MKTRNVVLSIAALALAAWGLAGDKDFWAQKPYTDWSEKEVERLLKSSPWAKTVSLSMGSRGMDDTMGGGGLGRVGGGARERDTESQGGAVPAGELGGMRGGGGMGQMMPSIQIVVAWLSKPVREGFARRVLLRNPEAPKQQIDQMLAFSSASTIELIVLTGGAPRLVGGGNAIDKMKGETFLQKKNKEKIPLENVMLPQSPGQPIALRFPRQIDGKPTVTLEDREIELVSRIGSNPIRAKWKLAEMVVNGELEI